MQGVGPRALQAFRAGFGGLFALDARPLLLAFGVCAGAAVYFTLPLEPDPRILFGIFIGALGAFLCARRWVPFDAAANVAIALLGLSMGAEAGSLRAHLVTAPALSEAYGSAMVEGWVREVEPGNKGVRLLIRTHSVGGVDPEEMPRYLRLTHTSRLEVAPGRFVRCWAMLRPPPAAARPGEYDYRRQAWFEQLGAVGFVQGWCRGGALGAPSGAGEQAALGLGSARRNLALFVQSAAGERAGGFAAALVSGDRSFMRPEDSDALRNTGLAHLLAISGRNFDKWSVAGDGLGDIRHRRSGGVEYISPFSGALVPIRGNLLCHTGPGHQQGESHQRRRSVPPEIFRSRPGLALHVGLMRLSIRRRGPADRSGTEPGSLPPYRKPGS